LVAYSSSTGGTTLIGATDVDRTVSSKAFTGLTPGTTYYFEFFAIGSASYTNSPANSPRVAISTNSTWTITYDATTNGGTVSTTSATYVSGATSLTLPTPTARTGYTPLGWYTQATDGTKVGNAGSAYTPTGSVTLYFQWTGNTYTVTYKSSPSGTGADITQSFTFPGSVTLRNLADSNAAFTRSGFYIIGWTTTSTANASQTHAMASTY
jgi:hypothetical protein